MNEGSSVRKSMPDASQAALAAGSPDTSCTQGGGMFCLFVCGGGGGGGGVTFHVIYVK